MATSRDDFVIAIRSAFLKRANKQRFSLIGLIFFSIGLIIFSKINLPFANYLNIGLNEIVYRASFIISAPENLIIDTYRLTMSHINLYDDHKKLKKNLRNWIPRNPVVMKKLKINLCTKFVSEMPLHLTHIKKVVVRKLKIVM